VPLGCCSEARAKREGDADGFTGRGAQRHTRRRDPQVRPARLAGHLTRRHHRAACQAQEVQLHLSAPMVPRLRRGDPRLHRLLHGQEGPERLPGGGRRRQGEESRLNRRAAAGDLAELRR
jgi:hypothetical protein